MWIEIFRSGTHKDSSGYEKTWTENDLETIASKYDPTKFEAPLVVGHPKDNSPAYGWVESLKREGVKLLAKVKPTVQEFIDAVRQGLYKKVSVSLYPDMSLRHIGFLGGAAPAIKDLQAVQFKEGKFSSYESDLPEVKVEEKENKKTEVFVMDEKEFRALEEKVNTLTVSLEETVKADSAKSEEIKTLQTELGKAQGELRKSKFESFCDGLMKEGKLTPAQRTQAIDFMEILHGTGEHEFSEGGKKSSLEAFKDFLSRLPKQIEFTEIATKGKAKAEDDKDKLISEYMDKHDKASYKEAVLAVSKKHPELFREAS
jgi:hypothetical protein